MWSEVKLVEHRERLRANLVQSILAYVGTASFLTYRDERGFVRYMVWFEDRHLNYVLGLHAANPDLGGVEIRPGTAPQVLEDCDIAWEMEMAGYGAAPLPGDTGTRSATAALGVQVTDIAYRLLVCQRVPSSPMVTEWADSGGKPVSIYRKIAGVAAREALEFVVDDVRPAAKPKLVKPKDPPYTHTRIILGGNDPDHLAILQDSFPAGSVRKRGVLRPEDVPALATIPPSVPRNATHFPVFNDVELGLLEIIPTVVTEVPMDYGRAITATTQPPRRFPEVLCGDDTTVPGNEALFLRDGAADSTQPLDAAPAAGFPVRMTSGEPAFPVRIMPGWRTTAIPRAPRPP